MEQLKSQTVPGNFTYCPTNDDIVIDYVILLFQLLQDPARSKMNALEKWLENVTITLNNLQNHLQEASTLSWCTSEDD